MNKLFQGQKGMCDENDIVWKDVKKACPRINLWAHGLEFYDE